MIDLRLIAYAPNGARLGPLPTPGTAQAGYLLNDVGALTFTYPPDAARGDLLGQPLEVVTEVSTDDGATWVEPLNGRFLYLRDGRDPIKADDQFAVEAPSYAWRLQKALVGTEGLNDEGQRYYTDDAPGAILLDLINRAQARGALQGLAVSWTVTNDSNGTPWPATQSIAYDPGANLLSVLQGMTDAGWVDWAFDGRTLRLYVAENPAGLARDQTTGTSPVVFRYGRDLTEAPFRRTWEGLADTAVILGDEGKTVTRTNPAAIKPWGIQETFVTASGVTDDGTLSVLGDAALTLTEAERAEHTLGLEFGAATHYPFRDYRQGDWVYAATDGGVGPVRMRARGITLTMESGQVGGNVTLNDRFLEADVLQNRRIQGILNGATQSGSGTTPGGIGPDILAPDKPTGLTASSAAYVDPDGFVRSQITLNWTDVTTNADNTPASDVSHYEVWARVPTESDWRLVSNADVSQWTDSPYEPGKTWEFKVRAVDTSVNVGVFSDTASTTTAADLTPPPKPSTPTATSRLGNARVSWDGLTATGTDMAATVPDWRYVEVHVSTVNNFTPSPTTRVGELGGPGYAVAGPLTYGTTYYARLVAYDSSGNASTASDVVTVVVQPLVDVSNFPDSAMTELYARTGKFLDLTADNFAANLIEGAWLKAGTVTADKISLSAQAQSVVRNSWMEDEERDAAGVGTGRPVAWYMWYGTGSLSFAPTPISGSKSLRATITAGSGGVTIGNGIGNGTEWVPVVAGQKWFARANVRPAQDIPADKAISVIIMSSKAPSKPSGIFDSNVVRQTFVKAGPMTAGTVYTLEVAATIPADHTMASVGLGIDVLTTGGTWDIDGVELFPATTDAQITDITPGKIKTGVLQATERIVAGSLTGARAELNGVGFQAFNPAGAKMFEVQANSGETVIGDSTGVHIRLGAFANVWNSGQSQALVRFGYTGSGWSDGQIHSQYFAESGTNWAVLRMTSPYEASGGFPRAPYLDLRQNNLGASKFYLRAEEANFTANTFIVGSSDGTSSDFRSVHANGFQFSDFSQQSRFRVLTPLGQITLRSANSSGATQALRLQATQVTAEVGGQDLSAVVTGTLAWANFNKNIGLGFNTNGLIVATYQMNAFQPIAASAFTVASDPRLKANATPVKGALATLRSLQVYDYDMEGLPPRKSPKNPPTVLVEAPDGPRPRPALPQPIRRAERGRGVMADEVRAILPDAVNEDEEGRLTVSLYDLLATTMAGLRELADEVDTLKATQSPRRNP